MILISSSKSPSLIISNNYFSYFFVAVACKVAALGDSGSIFLEAIVTSGCIFGPFAEL